ncbi:hypothetical protein M0804_009534 [Polistes exclamans]|nr:hypothetical protein M0804_009534 [Polistes exclamans]
MHLYDGVDCCNGVSDADGGASIIVVVLTTSRDDKEEEEEEEEEDEEGEEEDWKTSSCLSRFFYSSVHSSTFFTVEETGLDIYDFEIGSGVKGCRMKAICIQSTSTLDVRGLYFIPRQKAPIQLDQQHDGDYSNTRWELLDR